MCVFMPSVSQLFIVTSSLGMCVCALCQSAIYADFITGCVCVCVCVYVLCQSAIYADFVTGCVCVIYADFVSVYVCVIYADFVTVYMYVCVCVCIPSVSQPFMLTS